MTITPRPTPANETPVRRRAPRTTYDWGLVVPNTWQRWLETTEEVDNVEAMKRCTRVRVAAKWFADHHGYRLESRRRDYGRILDLRFVTTD